MTIPILDPGLSIFTGFGDDPAAAIKFGIVISDRMPNWAGGEARVHRFAIRHSNDTVRQYEGRNDRTLTVRLEFATLDDLEALDSVQGREATLRYRWGITTRAGGYKATLGDGVAYLVLPETELESLTNPDTPIGGPYEATATFRRPVGVGTLYDYAHYAEEDE